MPEYLNVCLMGSWYNWPIQHAILDKIHPQSNKFVTSLKINTIDKLKLNDNPDILGVKIWINTISSL